MGLSENKECRKRPGPPLTLTFWCVRVHRKPWTDLGATMATAPIMAATSLSRTFTLPSTRSR